MHIGRRAVVSVAPIVLVAVVLAGCGGSSNSSAQAAQTATQSGNVNAKAASLVPADIKNRGTLRVATSLQWPPFDYTTSSGEPQGLDIEMMKEISARLGLKPEFTDVKFPAIVPGVGNGRFDAGVDELSDTAERRATVRFIDYYKAGLGLMVPAGAKGITANSLCGHTLALTQGSSQVAIAQEASKKCVSEGKPKITFKYFPDSADTILGVANHRADGFLTDKAVGIYTTKQNKKLDIAPGTAEGSIALAGILVKKDNVQLAKAIQAALQSMIDDGSYKQLLAKYGVADATVDKATINGGA